MRKLKHIGNIISDWLFINSIIFICWGAISWMEVMCKNINPDAVYSNWNLFYMLLEKYL